MGGKHLQRGRLMIMSMVALAILSPVSAQSVVSPSETGLPIRLVVGDVDPRAAGLPSIDTASSPGRYIVQFNRPVSQSDRQLLEEGGARVMGYLPDYAFAVRVGPGASIPDVDGVSAIIEFDPSWRMSPRLADSGQVVRINVDPDVDAGGVATLAIDLGLDVIRISGHIVIAAAPNGVPVAVAAHRGVAWIEPFDQRVTHNEEGGGIIGIPAAHAAGYDGSTQIVAVADTGLGNAQEDVDTSDGIYDAVNPHPDIPSSRVVEVLDYPGLDGSCNGWPLFTFSVNPDGAQDVDSGHGSHVSGSVLSDGVDGTEVGMGQAPAASLVFQAIEDYADMNPACEGEGFVDGYYLLGIPDDLGDLLQDAYDLGARIHSDSWGSDVSGDYTLDSEQADQFMWDNPDLLIVTSAGNSGVDGNSDGVVDDDSTGSPATAKNLLTVGASEGARADNFTCDSALTYLNTVGDSCNSLGGLNDIFTYGAAWPADYPSEPLFSDPSAGNAEQMAAFSSRGPTDDGRIKPDIVAPGTWILSGYSSEYQEGYIGTTNPQNGLYQYDGWGFPFSTYYKYMGGTSMSAPIAAGGAAVIRDFYNKVYSVEASAALTKATLINSADDLLDENNDGADDNYFPIPNSHEGWGRINIAEATDDDHIFSDGVHVDTGETVIFDLDVAGGGALKVTVVWTDYPSTAAAGVNLVNNLDLVVASPGGATTYLGNVFDTTPGSSTGGWSLSGGSADALNNVENVYVESASVGTWTVAVTGLHVPQGPQPFAIVIEGATFADTEAPTWPGGATIAQTGQTTATVTVDWSANPATDNVGVNTYDVYVDGVLDQYVVGDSATISGLTHSSIYDVAVEARDAVGLTNVDDLSVTAATTDVTSPSWPDMTISTREVFETSFELNWAPATDTFGIASYTVSYAGDVLATTGTTTALITGLTAETARLVTVRAFDPTGNAADGPSLTVTTAPDFADTSGHIFEDDIAWMAALGITLGCDDINFCPYDELTRAQMASLLARAFALPAVAGNRFNDVTGVHTANINAVAEAGITLGCTSDGLSFCPNDPMTRAQMGSFMARAFGLDPSDANAFTDDDGSTHEENIDATAVAGITLGCDPGLYCPDDTVTRGQVAAFLHRGFVNLAID